VTAIKIYVRGIVCEESRQRLRSTRRRRRRRRRRCRARPRSTDRGVLRRATPKIAPFSREGLRDTNDETRRLRHTGL
jgi:hypothetical protein